MHKLSLTELASEGERLCRMNECLNGIKYFEAAIEMYDQLAGEQSSGKNNEPAESKLLHTMGIVFNQAGNACFCTQDYAKALRYHKRDLECCEKLGDECGKAKACGNIGNTLQLMGDFDEAIFYSIRNLDIAREIKDTTGEARALYNLGNIYQSKGKHMGRLTYIDSRDPNNAEFANEIKEVLMKAVFYYNETLKLVSVKDRAAEGRTYGNLGNTYYLLGDFDSAIECHHQRLKIAKEYGDRAAERRAYSNLGNSHIFQGKYNEATDYYLKAMNVAKILGDKAIEAQSYYSLGNVYTLQQDYTVAIDYHLRHLQIAQMLGDKIGESRAYWSLGNAYAALGDLENAISYANQHLILARTIGDSTSELTAKMNLYEYQNLLCSGFRDSESGLFTPMSSKYGRKYFERHSSIRKSISIDSFYTNTVERNQQFQNENLSSDPHQSTKLDSKNDLTQNQENLNDSIRSSNLSLSNVELFPSSKKKPTNNEDDSSFLDILSRIQSNRLDDQRCSIKRPSGVNNKATIQEHVEVAEFKKSSSATTLPNDEFFNLIMKSQRSRLEDQRTSMNKIKSNTLTLSKTEHVLAPTTNSNTLPNSNKQPKLNKNQACTVPPDDEFLSLIQKVQSRRLDEQRSVIKSSMFTMKTSKSGSEMSKKFYDR